MSFSSITVRSNGDDIDAAWFNALRTAGVIVEGLLGGGFITETSFTIANNQSSAANVTGLSFDHTLYRSAVVEYSIYRKTTGGGATEIATSGQLRLTYKDVAAAWTLTQMEEGGDDSGITFSMSGDQVQYTSSNITGTASVSKMTFTAITKGV